MEFVVITRALDSTNMPPAASIALAKQTFQMFAENKDSRINALYPFARVADRISPARACHDGVACDGGSRRLPGDAALHPLPAARGRGDGSREPAAADDRLRCHPPARAGQPSAGGVARTPHARPDHD